LEATVSEPFVLYTHYCSKVWGLKLIILFSMDTLSKVTENTNFYFK